jgi:hypothetical protein
MVSSGIETESYKHIGNQTIAWFLRQHIHEEQ